MLSQTKKLTICIKKWAINKLDYLLYLNSTEKTCQITEFSSLF